MAAVRRRIAAIILLGAWGALGGCTLFAPLSGLAGSGAGDDGGGTDGPLGGDAVDSTQGDDGPPTGDARSQDAPSSSDVQGGDASAGGFQRALTVTAADALSASYVVGFQLDTASLVSQGKMRSDLNDLRVFDPTGKELDRVVDTGSPSFVWFAITRVIASNASDTYSLHYGNPSAGPAPASGGAVFSFYDDFPGTSLGSQWVTLGSPTVSGGKVRLHAWDADASPNPDSMRTNPQSDNVQAASWLEIDATVTNPGSSPDAVNGFYYWFGFQRQGDFDPSLPWIIWIARQTNQVWAEDVDVDASLSGGALTQDTQPHVYVVARAPSSTSFYRDGVKAYTAQYPNAADYALMLRNWMQAGDLVVSLVRNRPLVDNEPTVTVGAEKTLP
ncbi:MAG TPA: DUF2341 domain-containing protein [Polyangiaceae bacterium]